MHVGRQSRWPFVLVVLLVAAYPLGAGPTRQTGHVKQVSVRITDLVDPVHRGDDITYRIHSSGFSTDNNLVFSFGFRITVTGGAITAIHSYDFDCEFDGTYYCGITADGPDETAGGSLDVIVKAGDVSPVVLTVTTDIYAPYMYTESTTVLPCSDTVPLQVAPANNAAGVTTNGLLSWNPIDRGHYTVYLGPTGSGCTTAFTETDTSSTQYLLDARTTYEWRVEASTVPGCPVNTTACQNFTTGNDCAVIPALLDPIGGAAAASPVTFRWTVVPEATSYSVFLSTGDAPFVPLGTTTTNSLTAALPVTGRSRWYVTAFVDGCSEVRSAIATFNVVPNRKRRSASGAIRGVRRE
jgi:hypothetical protein